MMDGCFRAEEMDDVQALMRDCAVRPKSVRNGRNREGKAARNNQEGCQKCQRMERECEVYQKTMEATHEHVMPAIEYVASRISLSGDGWMTTLILRSSSSSSRS